MDWGGVILIVAGLSLGVMVFETGAARWLAQVMLGRLALVPGVLQPFVIVLVVAALHMLFSSNTVTGAIIMPILIALAQDLGLDVWTIAAPAAFTATLAFILVTQGGIAGETEAAEAAMTVSSSPQRPTMCSPTGRSSLVKPQGMLAAGWPTMFMG